MCFVGLCAGCVNKGPQETLAMRRPNSEKRPKPDRQRAPLPFLVCPSSAFILVSPFSFLTFFSLSASSFPCFTPLSLGPFLLSYPLAPGVEHRNGGKTGVLPWLGSFFQYGGFPVAGGPSLTAGAIAYWTWKQCPRPPVCHHCLPSRGKRSSA